MIFSSKESDWTSCQVITPNLFKLYQKSFPGAQFEIFNYSDRATPGEYLSMIEELIMYSPDKIIICDHRPHPKKIIKSLIEKLPRNIPPIYCHLFGDFSLYSVDWLDMESYLQRTKIKFIVPSHRQAGFVGQFIKGSERFISYLPFPVDEENYQFCPEQRKKIKDKLQLNGQGKNFLYTGRLSAQKNVIPLINSFKKFLEISGSDAHLHVAGVFDDMGHPFFGQYNPPEFYWYELQEVLESYDDSIRSRIHILGELASDELSDYYQACDVFVSLSLHNDEDYGMCPAEAICCGMPLILSNWGGYASFCPSDVTTYASNSVEGRVIDYQGGGSLLSDTLRSLVPVNIVDSFYQVHYAHFIILLLAYDQKVISDEERSRLSFEGRAQFSVASNVNRLLRIHSEAIETFSSWNKKFQKFSDCFHKNPSNPFGVSSLVAEEDSFRIRSRKIYRDCYNEYLATI